MFINYKLFLRRRCIILKGSKLIRDSVHGYIEIPTIIVKEIIDTPVFQRLRQIEQTSMRVLYPSAHHDRFVHSIGVYHLGKLAFDGLLNNIKKEEIIYNNKSKSFWNEYRICFHLACLLHDCAHSPMSHSFEYGYMNISNETECKKMKERLLKSMFLYDDYAEILDESFIKQTQKDVDLYFEKPEKISPHEMVSAILVSEYFGNSGKLKNVLCELIDKEIKKIDLIEYTNFIQRAIMGMKYSRTAMKKKYGFQNCLISLLNGNFFDVDKLDYIIRDSSESGANNISIDVQRILNSLTLVETYNFSRLTQIDKLHINNSIYFTGIDGEIGDNSVSNVCECSLNLQGINLDGEFQGTLIYKGTGNYYRSDRSEGSRGDNNTDKSDEVERIFVNANNCKLQGRFNGKIECREGMSNLVDGVINATISGQIKGKIIGHIDLDGNVPITYEVGYMKNALNIIEDTLVARNRLYLWIYAHNKVTYNDYVLRKGVLYSFLNDEQMRLEELEKNREANQILYSKMSIDNMFLNEHNSQEYLLTDGDFICGMKRSLMKNKNNNHFAKEWLNREHRHAIWKSYAEYNSFFVNLSKQEQKILWNILFDSSSLSETEYPQEANSTEFVNSVLLEFNKSMGDDFECEYTWIKPSGIKLKDINTESIFIKFSDNSVKRMKDIVLQSKISEQYADENFFYLYSSKYLNPEERIKLISFLKAKCKVKLNKK